MEIDWIQLMSIKTKRGFLDKLNFIVVALTKFNKTEVELETLRNYWHVHLETCRDAKGASEGFQLRIIPCKRSTTQGRLNLLRSSCRVALHLWLSTFHPFRSNRI
jgi:hypothetical protein